MSDSEYALIFVTPEWMTKSANQIQLKALGKFLLFAINEAHLYSMNGMILEVYLMTLED